jgi:hypothetical protein
MGLLTNKKSYENGFLASMQNIFCMDFFLGGGSYAGKR